MTNYAKKLVRVASLALAVLMCLPLLMACGSGDETGVTTTTTAQVGEVTTTAVTEDPNAPKYDANGYLMSNLPADLNFGGETVTVVYWDDVERVEYEADAQTGEIINDAIYQRNLNVSEKLNVKLAFVHTKGNGDHISDFSNFVGNAYKSGEKDYDLISGYSRSTATCAMNGYCADLTDLEYLDWSMPWWPESLLDVVPIGGHIYFASGDASINVLHFMYGIYYNKDLLSDLKLDDPVSYVREGTWTLEKLIDMTKDVYQDLDNNGSKSSGDMFGFTNTNYHIDAFYTGSGLRLVEPDSDKMMVISDSFYSEKAVNLCSTIGNWLATKDAWCNGSYQTPFTAGNVLFVQNRVYMADNQLQKVNFSYGILPTPKYDTDQDEYISVVGNPFSLYAIYAASKDVSRAAAVLECWASEAYRTTTPAQFEVNMKLKYSETSVESEMYDIIRTTVCFDLGRLFNVQLANITDIFFAAAENNKPWASITKGVQKSLGKTMDNLTAKFAALQQ